MSKNTMCFMLGVTQRKWKERLQIAWSILRGKPVTFAIGPGLYHVNRNTTVSEIEL